MVFNATFDTISVISWRSVLSMEETGVTGEKQRSAASNWQTLSHKVVSSTPRLSQIRNHNILTLTALVVVNPTTIRSRPQRPPSLFEKFLNNICIKTIYFNWWNYFILINLDKIQFNFFFKSCRFLFHCQIYDFIYIFSYSWWNRIASVYLIITILSGDLILLTALHVVVLLFVSVSRSLGPCLLYHPHPSLYTSLRPD
jgi:hypothetical protein